MKPPAPAPASGRCAGFTLIEVAMSAVILALVLATAITASQRAFLELDSARNLETAANILQTELEKERILPWATVNDPAYQPALDSGISGQPSFAGRFTLSRTTAALAGHGGQMLQITLTVSWRGYDGHAFSHTQTTYYGQNGLYVYFAKPS